MDEEKKEGEGDNYKKEEGGEYKPKEEKEDAPKSYSQEPRTSATPSIEKSVLSSGKSLTDIARANPWMPATLVLGVLVVLLLIFMIPGGITGKAVSGDVAGENLVEFAKSQVEGMEVTNVEKESGLYKIYYSSAESDGVVYTTLDGKNLVSGLIPMSLPDEETPAPVDVPKSDKPEVELFVMTHCPYGTQSEKGMIPVIEALADKADIQIRFVHYFMHEPEETETPRQVCIREEQPEKWLTYLRCFLEDGDADRCLTEVGINQAELSECVENRAEGYYAEDSGLSEDDYGVQGSPTLVINGQIVSSARSPAAYLETICQAFNDVPSECELELDTSSPSPMWGWDASGADTTSQC